MPGPLNTGPLGESDCCCLASPRLVGKQPENLYKDSAEWSMATAREGTSHKTFIKQTWVRAC